MHASCFARPRVALSVCLTVFLSVCPSLSVRLSVLNVCPGGLRVGRLGSVWPGSWLAGWLSNE